MALLALGTLAACRGPGRDPSRFLPPDADAAVVVASVAELRAAAGGLWERVPEAGGVADLLRSVSGLDPRSEEATREQGLDPRRRSAVAWWRGALVVALPVSDAVVADRRLGLRLARLGFRELPPEAVGRGRRFEDVRATGREAGLWLDGDVALACAGPKGACGALAGLAPAGEGTGAGADADAAAREAGLPGAAVSGFARNAFLVDTAARELGLALPKGAAGILVRAAVGDLRVAVSLQGGVRVRVLLGPAGEALEAPAWPEAPAEGVLARVDADLGALPAGVVDALRGACGAACRDGGGVAGLAAAWDGRASLVLMEVRDAPPVPVTGLRALLLRVSAVLAGGLRGPGGAAAFAAAVPGLAAAWGLPLVPVPTPGVAAEARAVAAAGVAPVAEPGAQTVAAPPATDWAGRAVDGLEAAAAVADGRAAVAAGPGAASLAPAAARGESASLPRAGMPAGVVAQVALDPNGAVRALGGTGVDFVRHVVTAVRVAGARVAVLDGRLVVDAAVALR